MRKLKKSLSFAAALLAAALLATACGDSGNSQPSSANPSSAENSAQGESQAEISKDPITFSLIMSNWATWDEPMSADPVGQWITEQTGVTLEVELATGSQAEKYALLLSTGDLPDFMAWCDDATMGQFIRAQYLVPYDDYLDVMPNVVSMYGSNLDACRYLQDQKLYSLRQWYMGGTILSDIGFQINHKFMQDYMPDLADVKGEILLEDLEKAFLAYKADHPTNENGSEVFPLTNGGDLPTIAEEVFGITPWYEASGDHASISWTHPEYPELISWLNSWYQKGLLDPEFMINKLENAQTKISTGVSLAYPGHEANMTAPNSVLMEQDPDAYMMYYNVTASEGQSRYRQMDTLGLASLCVTTKCENLDRAMAFVNFLCDPLTNFVCCNGLEGGLWSYDTDGNIVIDKEKYDAYPETWDRYRHFGAYKYIFTLLEGEDPRMEGWDALVSNPMNIGGAASTAPYQQGRYNFFDSDQLFNPAYYNGISPGAGSEEAIIATKLTEIWNYAYPEMVMAESQEAALQKYNETIEELKEAGLEKYENAVSEKYFQKKAMVDGTN